MNYDKIFSYYASISINSFRYYNLTRSYNKSLLKLTLDGEHSCVLVSFTVDRNEDKIVLGAHQKHKNFFNLIKENYQYSNLRMILVKVQEIKDPEGVRFEPTEDDFQKIFE